MGCDRHCVPQSVSRVDSPTPMTWVKPCSPGHRCRRRRRRHHHHHHHYQRFGHGFLCSILFDMSSASISSSSSSSISSSSSSKFTIYFNYASVL